MPSYTIGSRVNKILTQMQNRTKDMYVGKRPSVITKGRSGQIHSCVITVCLDIVLECDYSKMGYSYCNIIVTGE